MNAAFVRTKETAAESDAPGIDGILGLEDEAEEDPADAHDDEQNLLERFHFQEARIPNDSGISGCPYHVGRKSGSEGCITTSSTLQRTR